MTVSTALKDIAKFLLFGAIYYYSAIFFVMVFDGIGLFLFLMPGYISIAVADGLGGIVAVAIGALILNSSLRPYPATLFSLVFIGLIFANLIHLLFPNGLNHLVYARVAHFVTASTTAWFLFHRQQKSNLSTTPNSASSA